MAQAMISSLYTHGPGSYRSLTVGRARQTAVGVVSKSESGGRSVDRVNLEQERKKNYHNPYTTGATEPILTCHGSMLRLPSDYYIVQSNMLVFKSGFCSRGRGEGGGRQTPCKGGGGGGGGVLNTK